MKVEDVKAHVGKKCLIILKNGYKYTVVIPDFEEDSFTATDVFGKKFSVDCNNIDFIVPRDRKNEQ